MQWDAWHSAIAGSHAARQMVTSLLDLPLELDCNSLLPWDGIAEVTDALRLAPGQVLADLGCGRGGYSLEITRRTRARLVGLDLSPVAVTAAHERAGFLGLDGQARFCVGDYTSPALRSQSVNAVACIDAIQFADPPLAALRQCRRVLAAGGRLAVTAWEPLQPGDQRLPSRVRDMNLARDLAQAGFGQIEVAERPSWYQAERALWEAIADADDRHDRGLATLRKEATATLAFFDARRRVLATAAAHH